MDPMRRAFLLAALLAGSADAAYMSSCNQLPRFGLGELGALPGWALPDCTDAALTAERNTVASTLNVLFIQSYGAKLAAFGGQRVAQDLQGRMRAAGYAPLASAREAGQVRTTYVNTAKQTAYTVLMSLGGSPNRMQLIKTRLK